MKIKDPARFGIFFSSFIFLLYISAKSCSPSANLSPYVEVTSDRIDKAEKVTSESLSQFLDDIEQEFKEEIKDVSEQEAAELEAEEVAEKLQRSKSNKNVKKLVKAKPVRVVENKVSSGPKSQPAARKFIKRVDPLLVTGSQRDLLSFSKNRLGVFAKKAGKSLVSKVYVVGYYNNRENKQLGFRRAELIKLELLKKGLRKPIYLSSKPFPRNHQSPTFGWGIVKTN